MLIVNRLVTTASPGLPWVNLGSDKGAVIRDHLDSILDSVLLRLHLLTTYDYTGETDPRQLLRHFAMDPIRMFIKDEPHPMEKISSGRLRIISSCSIVDEIVFNCFCYEQNRQEIDFHRRLPVKPGMGLSTPEQISAIFDYVKPWLGELTGSDVSGWDWSYKPWMFDMCVQVQIRCMGMENNEFFKKLIANAVHCLKHSMFVSSSGRMFVLSNRGLMKSGYPPTASWNSRGRVGLAYLCGATRVMAMGDDAVENTALSPDEFKEVYAKYGFKVTDVVPSNGQTFSFCSHTFHSRTQAIPDNPWKGFHNFLNGPMSDTEMIAFRAAYENHPRFEEFIAFGRKFNGESTL